MRSRRGCAPVQLGLLLWAPLAAAFCAAQTVTILHEFQGTDGAAPYAKLVQGPDGALYGTTTYTTNANGVTNGSGTIFRVTKSGSFTTLHSFSATNPPVAGLVVGPDGNLYGTTGYDCDASGLAVGATLAGDGSVFAITPAGDYFTTLQTFPSLPAGALMLGSDGNFYGATVDTVFKMAPDGTSTILHTFAPAEGVDICKLAQGPDGTLLGAAVSGGADAVSNGPPGGGTVFELSPAGALVFESFQTPFTSTNGGPCDNPGPAGSAPVGGLTLGPGGKYYGLAYCGVSEEGGLYDVTDAGSVAFLNLYPATPPLSPPPNLGPMLPSGDLTLGSDGNFYGVVFQGGVNGGGAIFSMAVDGTISIVYSFYSSDGWPQGGIVEGSDGRFYGTTSGGPSQFGLVYKLTMLPPAPSGVTARAGSSAIALSWTGVTSANTYSVFEGTAAGKESSTAVQTGITGTTATITGLTSGTTYYFTVSAVNEAGTGPNSVEVSATEAAATPAPSGSGGGGGLEFFSVIGLALIVVARRLA